MLSLYFARETLKPTVVVCGVLVVLFAGYSWVTILADATHSLLPFNMILTLIGFKIVIALEVLLPVSLYLGIILGFGRLYHDSEIKALMACGVSPYRILAVIFIPTCLVATIVAMLSLYLRPWAYSQSYQLKAEGEAGFRISNLDPGHFYERRDGSLVFYADAKDSQQNRLSRVFVQSEHGDILRVISAREAEEHIDPRSGISVPMLFNGFEYKLSPRGDIDHISAFSRLAIYPEEITSDYKRKAVSTKELNRSEKPKDIAELHWRFSTIISTLLLGLLAVPLSRAAPRQGKYAKVFTAVIIYAVYYFTGLLTKLLAEQGDIPIFPGLWWVVGALGVLVSVLLSPSRFTKNA